MTAQPSLRSGALSISRFIVVFLLLSIVPLALLTYLSLSLATDAVKKEVKENVAATASTSAEVVHQELQGLTQLVQSYARRPSLVRPLEHQLRTSEERAQLRFHLRELQQARRGIYTTFLAEPDGTLIDIVPATPSIVGKDFSFRDWYKGVTRTGRPYVSEAYRTQATGRPYVVAAATLVQDSRSRVAGILVAAYSVKNLQRFSDQLAATQSEVRLQITDQRGVLLASPGGTLQRLSSRARDPRVIAALSGRSGVTELDTPEGRRLSAYAPVPEIGWTVSASVPANEAFASVSRLRSAVLTIAGILAAVLLSGLALLVRTLRARRRAEEETQRLAGINRAVLDATPDAICLIDPRGRLALANKEMSRIAELHGLRPEGNVAELAAVVRDRTTDPEAYWAEMEKIFANPELESVAEYDLVDGRAFRRYTAPVRRNDGSVIGRIISLREVTAEHEAERLKSELMATVSHELRTPLASVLGYAELLRHRDVDGEKRRRYVETIHSEAVRLTNLINDFLDLQRIEEGSFTLALEPFELGPLLREQVELFSGQSDRHELELDLPDEPLTLLGERERIAQVVGNLVSNAIKYSPEGGKVRVRAGTNGDSAEIRVADSGLGIPADQQQKLFTKFFRVDSSDTREIGGTGLGLALCREIVEAHGGRMGFESVEGEGSTFWFTLPTPSRRNGQGPKRVLIVEDDPAAAGLMGEYLAEGYALEFAATGEDALQRAIAEPPALICLDIRLAGELDGWQVMAQLKANPVTAQVPVLVCTARNGRDRAAALGAADFITKPFSEQRIREAVSRVLPAGNGCVVVADDDGSVRRLVSDTLGRDGIEVHEAADGEEALTAIEEHDADALVLDLIMPRLDGFQVLERLQDSPETRLLPVVVLTARRLSAAERALLNERAVSLLEKSAYSPQELRRLVARAIAGAAEESLDRS